jgi:hypothetical protein
MSPRCAQFRAAFVLILDAVLGSLSLQLRRGTRKAIQSNELRTCCARTAPAVLQEALDSGCTAVCCDCVGADYIGDAAGKVWAVGTDSDAGMDRAAFLTVHGKVQSIHVNGRRMVVCSGSGSVHTFTMADGTWKPQAEVCVSLCCCVTLPCDYKHSKLGHARSC